MKTSSTFLLVAASALLASVNAHGWMTTPTPRPINAKYRKDCHFGLKGAGDSELQTAPLQLLTGRAQADQPSAPTFDIMNGCRGIEYVAGGPATAVAAGGEVPIAWSIVAPHPGYMEIYIVKATTDASGKIMYKQDGKALKRIDNFTAGGGGATSTSVTLPANLAGCGTAGACALQMYWHSEQAGQTYATCSDIVVSGGGDAPATTEAPAPAATNAPAPALTPATTPAPAPTTEAPGNDAATPTATKAACKKRMRRH